MPIGLIGAGQAVTGACHLVQVVRGVRVWAVVVGRRLDLVDFFSSWQEV